MLSAQGGESPASCSRSRLPLRAPELGGCQHDSLPKKSPLPDCPSPEAMFLVERRISLSWILRGQTRISMSLQSPPGAGSESLRSLTNGSEGWRLTIIVLRSLSLAG